MIKKRFSPLNNIFFIIMIMYAQVEEKKMFTVEL